MVPGRAGERRPARQDQRGGPSRARREGRRGRGGGDPPGGALEGDLDVGVPGHLPAHLVDAAVMLVAELDEVAQVGRAVLDPVPDVMHVGELGVRATRETAPLVPPPDLNPLGVTRIAPRPPEIEALPSRPVGGDEHLGVAGEPAGDLSRDRAQHVEFGTAFASGQEAHVGVDDHGRSVSTHAAGPGLVAGRARISRWRRSCTRRPVRRPSAGRTASDRVDVGWPGR